MDEQIQRLKKQLEELEQKKREEEERKKDPFRCLRERIEGFRPSLEANQRELAPYLENPQYKPHNRDTHMKNLQQGVEAVTRSMECDQLIIDMFTKIFAELQDIRTQVSKLQTPTYDVSTLLDGC